MIDISFAGHNVSNSVSFIIDRPYEIDDKDLILFRSLNSVKLMVLRN